MKKFIFILISIFAFSCQNKKIESEIKNNSKDYKSKEKVSINISEQAENPIRIIKKIFDNYTKYSESTDSPESKDLMSKSIKSIDKIKAYEDFEVLINVWMYYDPTDFPTRDLVFRALEKNKTESIKAIKNRIKNKKDWETSDSAPLSELNYLIEKLEK